MSIVVDAHLHVWDEFASAGRPALSSFPGQFCVHSEASPELLLDYMDEADVDKAVLVQPVYYGSDNTYLSSVLKRFPGKFAGVCVVHPWDRDAPDRLEYWVEENNIRGIRLRPAVPEEKVWFNHKDTYPLWERAQKLNVPVCVLLGPHPLDIVEEMAVRFEGVRLVLDHMAYPNVEEKTSGKRFQKLLSLSDLPNVYIKTSGFGWYSKQRYPYGDTHEIIKVVRDEFGAKRMLWGTDFPHVLVKCGYIRNLNFIRRELAFLSDEDKEHILGATAMSLWEF